MRLSGHWTALVVVGLAASWALSTVAMGGGPSPARATEAQEIMSGAKLTCDGDGNNGRRIRAMYVRGDQQLDRYAEVVPRFERLTAQIDGAFAEAGVRTGGARHVRFVHNGSCVAVIDHVVIPQADMANPSRITAALKRQGYDRPDRKYLYWYDAVGCGAALGVRGDDKPGSDNQHNFGPSYAALGTDCWNWQASARELLRTLGAVQPSAPHATRGGHCWDGNDIMCVNDGAIPTPPGRLIDRCPPAAANTLDCNADDYFNVNPPARSYLAQHWNVARSAFLIRG
jgi:hypothetical protein